MTTYRPTVNDHARGPIKIVCARCAGTKATYSYTPLRGELLTNLRTLRQPPQEFLDWLARIDPHWQDVAVSVEDYWDSHLLARLAEFAPVGVQVTPQMRKAPTRGSPTFCWCQWIKGRDYVCPPDNYISEHCLDCSVVGPRSSTSHAKSLAVSSGSGDPAPVPNQPVGAGNAKTVGTVDHCQSN